MKAVLKVVISRMQECSTWNAIGGAFATNALLLGPEYEKMLGACALVSFLVAAALREHGHDD